MKRKILIAIVLALSGTALFLGVKLFSLPDVGEDVRLNEESYYQEVNRAQVEQLYKMAEKVKDNAETSSHPRVQQVLEASQKEVALLNKTIKEMDRAIQWRANPDSLQYYFERVTTPKGNLVERTPRVRVGKTGMEISEVPTELTGLALLRTQNDNLFYYAMAMDSFMRETEAANFKFDTWDSFMQRQIKKESGWSLGLIAFNAPEAMRLHQKERIQVRISKQYIASLAEDMKRTESVEVDTLAVAEIMLVKLLGEGFKITSFDEEEQGITEDGYTQWEFDVTPQESGEQELFLKVGAVYYVPNLGATNKYFPVYEKRIQVQVSTWQVVAGFATERWEFLISTFLVPLGVWLFSRWRHRRRI